MKRMVISCLTALAVLVMAAQTGENSTLTPAQWQHALAVIAQYEALNGGYGQKTETFEQQAPQGYTLDDLDATYHGQSKWTEVYTRLKALENDNGTLEQVKRQAGELAPHVERDMKRFIEQDVAAQAPQDAAEIDSATALIDTIPVADPQRELTPKTEKEGLNTHFLFDLIIALLAIGALIATWLTRRELKNLRQATRTDLETTNGNMQQLANDVSQHVKALLQRVGNIEANQRVMHPHRVTRQHDDEPPMNNERKQQPAARSYYLSKPDENDCFNRVSDEFELGNSLFVLTTTDGIHGTYQVIDNRDVHRFALMMPTENLTRACSGNAIQMSAGMSRIVTDRPGEAQYDNGQWRVIVKAIIHYEA